MSSSQVKRKLHTYTCEQLAFIKERSNLTRKEIHKAFESHFGIKVPYNGIVALCTRNGWSNGNTGRFSKGHTLGKKYFLGDEYIDNYGYTVIVVDLPGRARFQQKHRWLWMENNGPIPEKCYVTFRDGDKTNVVLDNLILITQRELACMNINYQRFTNKENRLTYIAMSKLRCKVAEMKGV